MVDVFCGDGGNSIQLGLQDIPSVIGVDSNYTRATLAYHNCKVYQCGSNVSVKHGNFLSFQGTADLVLINPYIRAMDTSYVHQGPQESFSLFRHLQTDLLPIFKKAA